MCDFRDLFIDIECRWPGSVHDSKVFANSSTSMKMRNGGLPQTFQTLVPGLEKIPNCLIGDPAYPLKPYCMKEYDHCSNNEQVVFNNILRSARNPIECVFGRLKSRWGILTRKMDLKLETIPVLIYACFVLHNICEKNNSYIFFFYLGCLSQPFTNHRTAGEGGGHFFNSSLPLHRHLDISRAITAESSPLYIASSWTQTRNLWFPSASH